MLFKAQTVPSATGIKSSIRASASDVPTTWMSEESTTTGGARDPGSAAGAPQPEKASAVDRAVHRARRERVVNRTVISGGPVVSVQEFYQGLSLRLEFIRNLSLCRSKPPVESHGRKKWL